MKLAVTSQLREQCAEWLSRAAKWRDRSTDEVARLIRPRTGRRDVEVARAWDELRGHSALSWVPPMWRTDDGSDFGAPHIVRAVDKNLFVEITSGPDHRMMVQLRTGPLRDRKVGDGLDPVTPIASVNPDLTVTAPSFEEAVLELRDVVVAVYGSNDERDASPAHAKSGRVDGELSGRWHLTHQRS